MVAAGSRNNSARKSKSLRNNSTVPTEYQHNKNQSTSSSTNSRNQVSSDIASTSSIMSEPVHNVLIDVPAHSDSTTTSPVHSSTSASTNIKATSPKYIAIKFRDTRDDIRKVQIPFDTTLCNLQREISTLMEYKSVKSFNRRYIVSVRENNIITEIANDQQLQQVLQAQTNDTNQTQGNGTPRRSPAIRLHLKQLPRKSCKSSSPIISSNQSNNVPYENNLTPIRSVSDYTPIQHSTAYHTTKHKDIITQQLIERADHIIPNLEQTQLLPDDDMDTPTAARSINDTSEISAIDKSTYDADDTAEQTVNEIINDVLNNNESTQSTGNSTQPQSGNEQSDIPAAQPLSAGRTSDTTELQCLTNDLSSILDVHSTLSHDVKSIDSKRFPLIYSDLTSVAKHLKKQLSMVEQLVNSVANLLPVQQMNASTAVHNASNQNNTINNNDVTQSSIVRNTTNDNDKYVDQSLPDIIIHSSTATTTDNSSFSAPLTAAVLHSTSTDVSAQDVLYSQPKLLSSNSTIFQHEHNNNKSVTSDNNTNSDISTPKLSVAPAVHQHIECTNDSIDVPLEPIQRSSLSVASPDPPSINPSPTIIQSSTSDDNRTILSGDINRRYIDLLTHSNATIDTTSTFQSKLQALSDLGYTNRTFNEVLLNFHKGNLDNVISDLKQFYKK